MAGEDVRHARRIELLHICIVEAGPVGDLEGRIIERRNIILHIARVDDVAIRVLQAGDGVNEADECAVHAAAGDTREVGGRHRDAGGRLCRRRCPGEIRCGNCAHAVGCDGVKHDQVKARLGCYHVRSTGYIGARLRVAKVGIRGGKLRLGDGTGVDAALRNVLITGDDIDLLAGRFQLGELARHVIVGSLCTVGRQVAGDNNDIRIARADALNRRIQHCRALPDEQIAIDIAGIRVRR